MMRRLIACVAVFAVALFGAGSAFAGEVTGNGKSTGAPGNAKSLCAFSGLEDAPHSPGTTQSWGQIVRVAGPLGGANSTFVPGEGFIGCNARTYPAK